MASIKFIVGLSVICLMLIEFITTAPVPIDESMTNSTMVTLEEKLAGNIVPMTRLTGTVTDVDMNVPVTNDEYSKNDLNGDVKNRQKRQPIRSIGHGFDSHILQGSLRG